jgi:MinD superfamily P-loop ATPase
MKIAIASGKGGTGKTTVALSLAYCIMKTGRKVQYIDCDVEEPNAHIFLKPDIDFVKELFISIPKVDLEKCQRCGQCGSFCQYNAIVSVDKTVLTFEQLCRGCGGCSLLCPADAITEVQQYIGCVESANIDNLNFYQGRLKIANIHTTRVIKQLKKLAANDRTVIIDSPPGTSCAAIEAVNSTDLVLLVTEPTPFGLHDLKLAVETIRKLKLDFAVIVNRCDCGDNRVHNYCENENIEIVLKIPDHRRIATAYASGNIIAATFPEHKNRFDSLLRKLGVI